MASDQQTDGRGTGDPGGAVTSEGHEFDSAEDRYGVYECPECGNVVLAVGESEEDLTCHGTGMTELTEWGIDIQPPELRQVLLDAFGLPKVGLDICPCVIGDGPMSPGEVADRFGYDRSTVSRYLNDLVEIGLLQKARLNREGGGCVSVYHSIDIGTIRRETRIGFLAWAGEAAALIEEANATKADYLERDHADGLQQVFWETFRDG